VPTNIHQLGADGLNISESATPSNPPADSRTIFVDPGSGELSVRTSGGATVSLEAGGGGGGGTVTSVAVTTANGVSGSVANATTTPAITLTLREYHSNVDRGLEPFLVLTYRVRTRAIMQQTLFIQDLYPTPHIQAMLQALQH